MNYEKYKNTLPYASKRQDEKVWEAYKQAEHDGNELFKQDLFEELGISDNPKRHILYEKAWDMGHSSGLSEVFNYALDLIDLIE